MIAVIFEVEPAEGQRDAYLGIAADIAPMVADLLDAPGNDPTQKIAVIGDPRSNTIIIRAGSPERTGACA